LTEPQTSALPGCGSSPFPDDGRQASRARHCGDGPVPPQPQPDPADVLRQSEARRAVEVCAVGGHHLSLLGPPEAGNPTSIRCLAKSRGSGDTRHLGTMRHAMPGTPGLAHHHQAAEATAGDGH
jgi:hypothetical protein